MIEADVELRVRQWLAADAAAIRTPASLRERILDIPTVPIPKGSLWSRFASLPAISGGLVAAGVSVIVVTSMFFNLFDVPAGADGEPCSNRQIQRALDHLRDAEGYRYVHRDQVRQLDPDVEISFDDPQYAWIDSSASEGSYLAPDRARDVPDATVSLPLYGRGYLERLHIDGHTYEQREVEGTATWIETPNWPTANPVQGYLSAAFPTFSIPGVTSLEWRGATVPADLSGASGCTAAAALPVDPGPADFEIPEHLIQRRVVALRIDVATTRASVVYLGPPEEAAPKAGEMRSTWEVTWTTPATEEFVAPVDALPDPDLAGGPATPPPTPTPLPADPSAWSAVELPNDDGGGVSHVVTGDRYVAVGGVIEGSESTGMIWTSADGLAWSAVGNSDEFAGVHFRSVSWDGSTYLAMGYRPDQAAEGEFAGSRPETWISADGESWERGGTIGPDQGSGEVANVGQPISGGPGWVASGSIWALADGQQRPAVFTSPDGAEWTTVELPGTASGSIGQLTTMPDGSLLATGCEEPGATNSGPFGASCYMRPWRSDDGQQWSAGPILPFEVWGLTAWDEQLVAVGAEADPTGQEQRTPQILTSTDGSTWTPLPGFSSGSSVQLTGIRVVGEVLVMDGQLIGGGMYPQATAWRSTDGNRWDTISLGLPTDALGTFLGGVIESPTGLVFLGEAPLSDSHSIPVMWVER